MSREIWIALCIAMAGAGFAAGLLTGRLTAPNTTGHALDVDSGRGTAGPQVWICSMHPQNKFHKKGQCPICKMDLIPLASNGSASGPRTLTMSEAARKLAEIRTVPVERKTVTKEVRLQGKVAYDERKVASISAWFPGRIERLFVDFTGTRVEKGQHLVEIYSPELLTAQQELLEAKRRVDEARTEQSAFLVESNRRALHGAREKLRLWGLKEEQVRQIEQSRKVSDRMTVYAPASGVVVQKLIDEGDYVKTGSRLFKIADLSKVWVVMDAYESDLQWLHYAQDVEILTETYPGEFFGGQIAFIQPELDERTRTVKVRVNVANPGLRLKPGMFVRAVVYSRVTGGGRVLSPKLAGKWIGPMHPEIIKDGPGQCDICGMDLEPAEKFGFVAQGDEKPPVVVPVSAVLRTGRRAVVYVEIEGRDKPTFQGKEVVLGPRAGNYYLVSAGLKEGERVVVNGNFKIDSELQIQAKRSMMSPEGGGRGGHHHQGSGSEQAASSAGGNASSGKDGAAKHRAPYRKNLSPVRTPRIHRELAPVFETYLKLQQDLSGDDLSGARENFATLGKAVGAVDASRFPGDSRTMWAELSAELENAAKAGHAAQDIRKARTAFFQASRAAMDLERAFGHKGEDAYKLIRCPLVFRKEGGGLWLQLGDKVRNPYYGSEMISCGEILETFPPAQGARAQSGHRHEPTHDAKPETKKP